MSYKFFSIVLILALAQLSPAGSASHYRRHPRPGQISQII